MTGSPLTLIATVSAATVGGAYLVFSTMVMPALDRLGPDRAASAMRAVNTAAERPPFLALFFGSALAAGAVVSVDVAALASTEASDDGLRGARIAGAGLVLLGFITTLVRNVPLNRALDLTRRDGAWHRYRGPWVRANSIRAVASIAGAALLMLGSTP
ncbi:DUF1772 domain-containing protein [Labedella endophytica]|uniref:DUF1772 domain-containing protein n=1 Tax=Labedella endophytica TaxID=1523160 RepID=A0A3S0XC03_9MICO|nr:anthrone oxygenase family protein [Labedella endophytica]RUR01862.1 DUF1772 domain-containing protein [Labedella endophytica]